MIPTIIDVETSGAGPGGYPVEIGIAAANGKTHCFLVKPPPQWLRWDHKHETIHEITLATLKAAGKEPVDVALALNSLLKGDVAYCEQWGSAMTQMSLLFYTAGVPQMFSIESLHSLARQPKPDTWNRLRQSVTADLNPQRRRASTDALILQKTYLRSLEEIIPPDTGI